MLNVLVMSDTSYSDKDVSSMTASFNTHTPHQREGDLCPMLAFAIESCCPRAVTAPKTSS